MEHIIVDEQGKPVPQGEIGEILVKGLNVARGYVGGSDSKEGRFLGNGFRTGDIGFVDQEGYLSIIGRNDDIINVGGRKFHPVELELLISKHFPHFDCAISQREDPMFGFRPVLCLANDHGDAKSLLNLISQHFESYKTPSEVVYLNEIPKTANGKILRGELKKKIC